MSGYLVLSTALIWGVIAKIANKMVDMSPLINSLQHHEIRIYQVITRSFYKQPWQNVGGSLPPPSSPGSAAPEVEISNLVQFEDVYFCSNRATGMARPLDHGLGQCLKMLEISIFETVRQCPVGQTDQKLQPIIILGPFQPKSILQNPSKYLS